MDVKLNIFYRVSACGRATTGCPALEFHYLALLLSRFIQAFFIHNAEKYKLMFVTMIFLQNLQFLGIHTCETQGYLIFTTM